MARRALILLGLVALWAQPGVAESRPDLEEQLWHHRNLGKAFYENPATQHLAVAEFAAALELAPASARERLNYGLALLRAGREADGIAQLEAAQRQDPAIPHTWWGLGIAYKRAGRHDEARRQLEGMRELVPDDAATRYNLGILYKLADDPGQAREEFRRAAELDPRLAAPHFQLATSLRQAGKADEARAEMEVFRDLKRQASDAAVPEDLEWNWYSEIYETRSPVAPTWDSPPASVEVSDLVPAPVRRSVSGPLLAAARGDYDDDGDLDLVVVGESGAELWEWREEAAAPGAGIGDTKAGGGLVASGVGWAGEFRVAVWLDYDHDYDLDLVLLGHDRRLLRNQGDAGWSDRSADMPFRPGKAIAAARLDVMADSQGFDLAVAYDGAGGVLYRDRLGGRYEALDLPALPAGVRDLVAADLDRDGWTDLYAETADGGVMLRNDAAGSFEVVAAARQDPRPAETGPELRVELRGVKNLKAAQGSEVEVKAGSYYRKRLYDGVPIVFRLPAGTARADAVRITWPNGLIQNETAQEPGDHLYEEAPRLSGSCPMIFTWNGADYEFITDVLGVAPLGAAAGDGPGGREYFPVDHDEVIQIRGDQLVAKLDDSGRPVYELRITEELREVAFLDQVRLVAVDHDARVDLFVNSKFQGPPFPEERLFAVSEPGVDGTRRRVPPRRAVDDRGRDVLDRILTLDRTYPDEFRRDLDGSADLHWLELDFGDAEEGVATDGEAILVLSGWVDWADGSTFFGASQGGGGLVMPYLQVRAADGRWVTVIDDMGLPAGKPKTIVVDLTDRFLSTDRSVRIVTNLALYWDQAFLGESAEPPQVVRTDVPLASAELRFRGFSRTVIHPRRLQPEHFVYADVRPWTMWNQTPGLYTRYGDVASLIRRSDDRLLILGSGDEVALQFDASALPAEGDLPTGVRRDFLLIVDGWAKDGDANTAHSQTVEPLPFHAMPEYPYEGLVGYPDDPQLRVWREHYNTRPALRLLQPLSPSAPVADRTRPP